MGDEGIGTDGKRTEFLIILQKPLATGFHPMAKRFNPTPRVSGGFILAEGYNLPLILPSFSFRKTIKFFFIVIKL